MNFINSFVDKIFIINLDSRPERWSEIEKHLKDLNITNYERFAGIVPNMELVDSDKKMTNLYQYLKSRKKKQGEEKAHKYGIGASGCLLSHQAIIQLAKERGYQKILILEDDARFFPNYLEILQKSLHQLKEISYDMLYFSVKHKTPGQQINKNCKKIREGYTTVAYSLTSNLYDFIIDNCIEFGKEIDVFYAESVHPKYNCYATDPIIVFQKPGFSDIVQRHADYAYCKKQ